MFYWEFKTCFKNYKSSLPNIQDTIEITKINHFHD